MQLENFISPIADKVFALLTPAALTHAFDGLSRMTTAVGEALAGIVGKLGASGVIDKLKTIGETVTGGMGSFFDKLFTQVQDPISGVQDVMTASGKAMLDELSGKMIDNIKKTLDAIQATVSFIHDHFEAIKNSVIAAATAWAAIKVWDFGAKVAEIFKAIGSATFAVGRATINVGAAEGTAGKATGWLGQAGGVLGRGLATGEALGAGASVGVLATAGALYKPAEEKALERLGVSADNAANALDGFPREIHTVTDKIPIVGSALGTLASAAIATAAQIAMIPAAMGDMLLHPWQAGSPAELDQLHQQQAEALKHAGKTQSDVDAHWNNYPKHAAGGIFTRPHIGMIAERGPEAVVPLSRGGGLGHHVSIDYHPVINGGDAGGLSAILRSHAEEIAEQVRRVMENTAMRTATV